MIRSAALVLATLLFCLTEPGQAVLQWLDMHVDMDGLVKDAVSLVQSWQEPDPAP